MEFRSIDNTQTLYAKFSTRDILHLRMVELLSFLIIVLVTKQIGRFSYNSDLLLLFFFGAGILQFCGKGAWEWWAKKRTWTHSKADRAILWYSSYLDMLVVVSLIYFTGTIESPFLILLTVPLFFASHTYSWRITLGHFMSSAIVSIGVLGYLELKGIIPHFNVYLFEGDIFLNGNYYVGSLLVLGAFLGLVLFFSAAFQDRLQLIVDSQRKRDKEAEDKILELTRLYDISLGINSVMTLDTLLKIVAKEATLLLSQPWAGVVLLNNKHEVTDSVFVGLPKGREDLADKYIRRWKLSEWILDHDSPVIIEDVEENPMSRGDDLLTECGICSLIGYPLTAGRQVLGVLYAGDFVPKRFEKKHLRLLTILCNQLSVAIEKSKLYESLERKIRNLEDSIANLERANVLKSEFVSHVSHELRTPLTSIKAYVETLCEHADDPEFHQGRHFLEVVSKETDRLIRIVDGILDVSQIEFGQRPLERKSVQLQGVVQDAIFTMRPNLCEKRIHIFTRIPDTLPNIDADEDLMKQVFINLISNAAKYSDEGRTVTISAEEGAVDIRVSVEDEGIGIPKDLVGKIFDKYFRVKAEDPSEHKSSGLGLAIVKNIIEQHGGTITVESEEGVGTNFTLTIPKEHCYNDLLGYIAEVVSAKEELREMLELIVRMIAELLSAKIVSLMLLDKNRSELFIKVSYGLDKWVVEQTRVRVGEGISGKVAESGVPIFIDNIEQNEIYACPNNPQYDTMSLISVPLFINNLVVGVINVNNKISGKPFTKDDVNLLISFGERISKALERVRMVEDTHAFLNETIEAFRRFLDAQSKSGRIETIMDLAVKVSRKLGLSEKEVSVIQYVASVHDIGMTKVSDDILNKTLSLSSEEIEQIQQHPRRGNELIRPLEFVELVSKIILYHHERIDGMGYPMGLKRAEIPTGSRILAVIDAYQSMTVDQPYRKRMSVEDAVEELVSCADRQFDPDVVEAFVDVLREEGELTVEQAKNYQQMLERSISSGAY